MKTPPLLIGAAILFWGLEVGQLVPAACMAVAVEASRWIAYRWDFKEADFKRVSALCTLALLSIAFYRFRITVDLNARHPRPQNPQT